MKLNPQRRITLTNNLWISLGLMGQLGYAFRDVIAYKVGQQLNIDRRMPPVNIRNILRVYLTNTIEQ